MCWDQILVEGKAIRKWLIIGISITFGITIYSMFLISRSFSNYTFSPDIDDIMNNWQKNPISNFLDGNNCNEYLSNYNWSGIRSGCDCSASNPNYSKQITFFSCSTDQLANKCVNVNNEEASLFNTWPTSSNTNIMFKECVFRLSGQNFINSNQVSSISSCSSIKQNNIEQQRTKCGFNSSNNINGYQMCLTQCPVISLLSQANSNKPEYQSRLAGSLKQTFFYTSSSYQEQEYPLVEIVTQIPTVCMYKKDRINVLNLNYQNAQYNSNWQYTLQSEYLTDNCIQQDTRYFPIAQMPISEYTYLQQNGIKTIPSYPGYPKISYITLYGRKIISWSENCREKNYINQFVTFYNNQNQQVLLRFAALILQILMVIITSIILTATICEIGWRLKSQCCCRYQSPDCLVIICRKNQLTNNEVSITDYWRLYDPCYVIWFFLYISAQISCFIITIMFAAQTNIDQSQIKNISSAKCSDDLTNSIFTQLSSDISNDVWPSDLILLIIYPLFLVFQSIIFIFLWRVVTNHKREWFVQKMNKKQLTALSSKDPVLTSEESEEENFKKNLVQQKIIEKQRQQQNQVLQADFIQRQNLLNQSLSYFNTSRNNVTNNGQTYLYELSRITYLQQNQQNSLHSSSFNASQTKNYYSNAQKTQNNSNQNNVNISIPNSLNNTVHSEQFGGGNYQSSQESKQKPPPQNKNNNTNPIFQNNQKKLTNHLRSTNLTANKEIKQSFLQADAI
ncbi:hypothetical protein ABPG72_002450 [Tetrahymena utriculariae]